MENRREFLKRTLATTVTAPTALPGLLAITRQTMRSENATTAMKSEEICYSDATTLAKRIRSRDISPVEVVKAHLERIEAINSKINALVTPDQKALHRAEKAERAMMRGEIWGPLHGVPFTAKDCFDTEGVRTTRGSRIFLYHIPTTDATAVNRLKKAGGILLGKTNLPEFSLWSETSNRIFGPTENPWQIGRTPGGSSGGEAAAISAGLSPLGIGTDLGGSNRLPAHYCGLVGFKPTHGRIPLTGSWPDLMSQYMHVGPITRTVQDAALVLSILSARTRWIPTRSRHRKHPCRT